MADMNQGLKCSECGYVLKEEQTKCPRCGTVVQCSMSCPGNCLKCFEKADENQKSKNKLTKIQNK